MKKIKAIIQPFMLDKVCEALQQMGAVRARSSSAAPSPAGPVMLLNQIEKALMNNPLRPWVQRRLEAPRLLDLGGPAPGDVSRIEAAQGLHGIKTSSDGSLFAWFVAEKPVNRPGTAPLGDGGAP